MTSRPPRPVYVWVWLPGETTPVPAGVAERHGDVLFFQYGHRYLERANAIPLYLPELPLLPGPQRPPVDFEVAGCIRDAAPDAWGQRVIFQRVFGSADRNVELADLTLENYLLESGSDRVGALDFQASSERYEARTSAATLEELISAASRVEAGEDLTGDVADALFRGSSMGGARPKVSLGGGTRQLIAKFSSVNDVVPVVKAEAAAMELARRVGLDVPETEPVRSMGREVLVVERFDRTEVPGERRMVVSALTLLGLHEMQARHASYADLADIIRQRFTNPGATLRELFARIVFNICIGNTDDHPRNHAAFWDGATLRLTPAYDLCPQVRAGEEAQQLMAIGRDGARMSQFVECVRAAPVYQLSGAEAREIIDHQVAVIRDAWDEVADLVGLASGERRVVRNGAILRDFALQGYDG